MSKSSSGSINFDKSKKLENKKLLDFFEIQHEVWIISEPIIEDRAGEGKGTKNDQMLKEDRKISTYKGRKFDFL